MKSYQQFFAELKRRKVFRVTAVYGVTAFVLLQVADLLGQGLRLGDTFMPFITAVVLLGFPLALIVAWAFELTPDGVRKTGAAEAGEIEEIVAQPMSQRWPAGLMALVGVAALVAGAWWVGRQSTVSTASAERGESVQLALADVSQDSRPSIAVLPFVNMSADEDQEYFSDGMTEEILSTLANIANLRVSGRTSAFAYKGRSVDLRQIGHELGVRYLVEGSVRKAGRQLRITAQLIDSSDGSHLWSDQYDREMKDVFAIQTDIASAIAAELRVSLGLDGDETLVTPTGDLEAYDLYLAGRRLMRGRGAGLLEAVRLFRAAIKRDSTWAPAWAALGEAGEISIWYPETYDEPGNAGREIERRLAEAEAAATRALDLDPRNASALVAIGSVYRDRGAWRQAEEAYRKAIALDPDNAEAHQQYGELLGNRGRMAESVRALDRAAALDPALVRLDVLAFALERDDRPDEAIEVYEIALKRDPDLNRPVVWMWAAAAFASAGRIQQAVDTHLKLQRKLGPPPGGPDLLTAQQWRVFVEARAARDFDRVPERLRPRLNAADWARMGMVDSAFVALSSERLDSNWVPGIWDPAFDSLRSESPFRALFSSDGLSGATLQRTPLAERTRPLILRESSP